MLRNTAVGLAAAASLSAAALTPALAESNTPQGFLLVNYAHYDEEPEAAGCPRNISTVPTGSWSSYHGATKRAMHAHSR